MRKPHGFKLIELLVVIAIIALFIAILIAGTAVDEKASQSGCLSNKPSSVGPYIFDVRG